MTAAERLLRAMSRLTADGGVAGLDYRGQDDKPWLCTLVRDGRPTITGRGRTRDAAARAAAAALDAEKERQP